MQYAHVLPQCKHCITKPTTLTMENFMMTIFVNEMEFQITVDLNDYHAGSRTTIIVILCYFGYETISLLSFFLFLKSHAIALVFYANDTAISSLITLDFLIFPLWCMLDFHD